MFEFYFPADPSTGEYFGWSGNSWLLTSILGDEVVQVVGQMLWAVIMIAFVAAGVAVLMKKEYWRKSVIVASTISLLAFSLFWDGLSPDPSYFIAGPVLAAVILVTLLVARWPPDELVFGIKNSQN
ncbi:MAG: hypothetical protein ACFFD4_14795 [Candidatus Odinarchaeota archaeon]